MKGNSVTYHLPQQAEGEVSVFGSGCCRSVTEEESSRVMVCNLIKEPDTLPMHSLSISNTFPLVSSTEKHHRRRVSPISIVDAASPIDDDVVNKCSMARKVSLEPLDDLCDGTSTSTEPSLPSCQSDPCLTMRAKRRRNDSLGGEVRPGLPDTTPTASEPLPVACTRRPPNKRRRVHERNQAVTDFGSILSEIGFINGVM